MKKTISRILFFGILLAILMLIVGKVFHLSTNTLIFALSLSYFIFLIIIIPYQMRKRNLLNHKIEVLLQKMRNGDIEDYITGMKALLNEAENDYLKAILTINMSVGYTLKGEFEKANSYLDKIDASTIDKRSQMVLYHNIALNAFWAGETKKACVIMESHKKILQQGLESHYFKNSFSETFALWSFAEGKREQGFGYLENIINDQNAKLLERQAAQVIWAKQKMIDKQFEQAEQLLQKIVSETQIPYLKKEAEQLLHQLK